MNNKLPYQGMADQVASRGRYGDTTLMHVNPVEVQGLASLVPLTVNPDTGYPEAFLLISSNGSDNDLSKLLQSPIT